MLSTSSCNRLLLLLRQIRTAPFYGARYISHSIRHVSCVSPGQVQLVSHGCCTQAAMRTILDEKCRFPKAERHS